ncbi:methyltransferase domain-containing protein [Luteimonas sp. MC1572]|uniref:class I SAM-dependent methyltransferase n=1 Tax=Luteimonas sp. MC1572 TaxID=2799325 RepID=UPI0018F0FBF4|nr:methyltransferase domain-containing protein [Luteimonas sp. MC1572]MBJ6980789.1 methyltransferase domain-containing protein [Luteimonas sp. MC1572]QQO02154.1 methyltransferase domain-containing protein [Luteimonas sp. MC1572]
MSRNEVILSMVDRRGNGLEIGPSHSPVAPKRDGFNVQVVDHADRAGLVEKYRAHGVDLDRIEEVDFVWNGTSYLELTGKPNHYDWIIASHVIEHVPDMVGFIRGCDSVLRHGGVLALAVPDKRYCFDRFRSITGIHSLVDAHLEGRRNHSPGRVADYFLNVVTLSGVIGWAPEHARNRSMADVSFVHGLQDAKSGMQAVVEADAYLDIHAWCFTPSSFRLLVEDLYQLGLSPLREARFQGTGGSEFFVALSREGTGPGIDRFALLHAIDEELADVRLALAG